MRWANCIMSITTRMSRPMQALMRHRFTIYEIIIATLSVPPNSNRLFGFLVKPWNLNTLLTGKPAGRVSLVVGQPYLIILRATPPQCCRLKWRFGMKHTIGRGVKTPVTHHFCIPKKNLGSIDSRLHINHKQNFQTYG